MKIDRSRIHFHTETSGLTRAALTRLQANLKNLKRGAEDLCENYGSDPDALDELLHYNEILEALLEACEKGGER